MSPTSALTASMLMMLGCASRLWNLHLPSTPVYDETHVGRFLNWYHERRFFFDVHPPLAKLLMYWTATALGFDGRASCPYDDPSPYVSPCSLAPQRLVPALCGACMVPLTYATCCAMELHPLAALLCSWLVLVDPLWIGLSRIHLNDMVQMLFIALTHLLALYACAPPLPNTAREQPRSHLQSIGLLVGTGVCLGCALQCKFAMALTTVAWLGLQNLITLGHLAVEAQGVSTLLSAAVLRGSLLLGIPVAIHLGLFAVHLSYLPNTGNGDGYLSAPPVLPLLFAARPRGGRPVSVNRGDGLLPELRAPCRRTRGPCAPRLFRDCSAVPAAPVFRAAAAPSALCDPSLR